MKSNKIIKPSLGSYVWVKCNIGYYCSFSKVKVVAKGKDLFVHDGCFDDCKVEEFRKPLYYANYKDTWFKSLKEIREKYIIKKVEDDYYEEKGISRW